MAKKVWLLGVIALMLCCGRSGAQGTWHNLDGGLYCSKCYGTNVYTICADTVNNYLYAGGLFDTAGSYIHQWDFARWDGVEWDSMPHPIAYEPDAMIMYKGQLYAGDKLAGDFTVFDGTTWHILGGVTGEIYCFTIYKDTLYAGGSFTTNDKGTPLNNIAKWDGSDWQPLDTGVYGSCCPEVKAMAVYNDTLYVGGYFTNAGKVSANSIAKWDGSNWSSLQRGIKDANNPGLISAIDTFDEKLYVGGQFDSAGGIYAFDLASWDHVSWDSLPEQVNGFGDAMKSFDGYLFVPVPFPLKQPTTALAKFDGNQFSSVDSGVYGLMYSMAVWNGSLYVGGEFDTVGKTVAANHIARWTPGTTTGVKQLTINNKQVSVYPNPTSGETTVTSSKNIQYLKVTDLLGRLIYEAQPQQLKFTFDLKETGIYFVTVTSGDVIETKKVVVVR